MMNKTERKRINLKKIIGAVEVEIRAALKQELFKVKIMNLVLFQRKTKKVGNE